MATEIPFVGPSYDLAVKKADVQRSVNLMPTPIESGMGKAPMFLKPVPGLTQFSGVPDAGCPPLILEKFDGTGLLGGKTPDVGPTGWVWWQVPEPSFDADLRRVGSRVISDVPGYENPYGPMTSQGVARLATALAPGDQTAITIPFPFEFAATIMHDWNAPYEYPKYSTSSTQTYIELNNGLTGISLAVSRTQTGPYPPGTSLTRASVYVTNEADQSIVISSVVPNGDPVKMKCRVEADLISFYIDDVLIDTGTAAAGLPNTFKNLQANVGPAPSWISYVEVSTCEGGVTPGLADQIGTDNPNGKIELSWSAQAEAAEYRVYYSDTATPPNPADYRVRLSDGTLAYTFVGLPAGTWYWWVGSVGSGGSTDLFLSGSQVVT